MQYFNYTDQEWTERKGIFTAKEIIQQPKTWINTMAQIKENQEEIRNFLKPFLEDATATIIFIGAGTSEFVGRGLASTLNAKAVCSIQVCGTTDMVVAPENYIKKGRKTLLVSFGRSGNSPESIGALDAAEAVDNQVNHLFITCNKEGALAKRAAGNSRCLSLCLTDETHDQSFAMTSSFSNMYLAAMLCLSLNSLDSIETDLEKLADKTEGFLAEGYKQMLQLVKEYKFERIVYLGAEQLKGISQESALKMLELTAGQVVTMFDTPLGFRHGPKSIINDKTLTVIYLSDEAYRRQYEIDLIKEMSQQRKGNRLVAVCNLPCSEINNLVDEVVCMDQPVKDTLLLGLSTIVVAQVIALFKSIELDITPDNPCPTGEVNRVVQGVTLYPFKG